MFNYRIEVSGSVTTVLILCFFSEQAKEAARSFIAGSESGGGESSNTCLCCLQSKLFLEIFHCGQQQYGRLSENKLKS